MNMMLVVGLGNPGEQYEKTRHNAGFMAADIIAANFQFPNFSFQSKFNVKVSEGQIGKEKILLIKPQTYMNNSGKAVRALTAYYKLPATRLIVVHDDIDIPLGEIRLANAAKGSGSAGHRGVESIMTELGTPNFHRIRIGILPSRGKPKNTEEFVLKRLTQGEQKTILAAKESIVGALESLLNKE